MSFRERLYRYMQGRNGVDTLFYGLSVAYIVLMFINVFARSWTVQLLGILICLLTFFRVFSKNIVKRRSENVKFEKLWFGAKKSFVDRKSRMKQNKTYCFKRCPGCRKTLRLPRVKGKHTTKCPSCHTEFNITVWFKKK